MENSWFAVLNDDLMVLCFWLGFRNMHDLYFVAFDPTKKLQIALMI